MHLKLEHPVTPFAVLQNFGVNGEYYRANGIPIDGHNGLDLRATHGQPVYASHDGIAYITTNDGREGVGVVLRTLGLHLYENSQVYFKSIYWHLVDPTKDPNFPFPITNGQQVKTGDLIGYADNSGFSAGSHLHFALKPQAFNESNNAWYNTEQGNGYAGAIDPTPYLPPIKYIFLKDLELGMYNIDVLHLQITLNRDPQTLVALTGNGSMGKETPYFGTLTKNAVIRYQKKHGINPIGRVGPITRAHLMKD